MGLFFHKKFEIHTLLSSEEVKERLNAELDISFTKNYLVPITEGRFKDIGSAKVGKYKGRIKGNRFKIMFNDRVKYKPWQILIFGIAVISTSSISYSKETLLTRVKGIIYEEDYGSNIRLIIKISFFELLFATLFSFIFIFVAIGLMVLTPIEQAFLKFLVPFGIFVLIFGSMIHTRIRFNSDAKKYIDDLSKIFKAKYIERL